MYIHVLLLHRFADAQAPPPLDDSQDISDAGAMFFDGVTVITFTRPRNSVDSRDISLDEGRFLLFAWGGSVTYGIPNSFGYHGYSRRVSTLQAVRFPSATDCPSKSIACICISYNLQLCCLQCIRIGAY